MSNKLTAEELAAIRELNAARTQGEWRARNMPWTPMYCGEGRFFAETERGHPVLEVKVPIHDLPWPTREAEANLDFACACSTAVPALLARIAEQDAKNARLREALEACLLFHDSGSWDMEKRLSWQRLTRQSEATTRALCDTLRAALKEAQGE